MTKEDLRRIEKQADVSFEKGQIIGKKAKWVAKRSAMFLIIFCSSIVLSIVFFIYGFLDHKHKIKL